VEEDKSPPLTPDQIKCVQKIVGTLLYYGWAVDSTLLTALSAITARQSNGTQAVAEACHQLLDYVAMHPDAGICYHACDMILAIHTDASYLSKLSGKSRAVGHFYLTNKNDEDFNNGAILMLSSIIKHIIHQHRMRNLPLFIMDANTNKPPPSASNSRKWDIPNQPQLPLPPTTSLHRV
jgi:hypothetical protein